MDNVTEAQWIDAIAKRLADEWSGKVDFPEDALLLEKILRRAFLSSNGAYKKLIGTGVIEEDFFEVVL